MSDWVSVLINFLLLIVTLSTVIYASKTLLMEYSSNVIVSGIKKGSNIEKEYQYSWEVEIENVGKGYIVKAFILLSMQSKNSRWKKQYFLSKPVVGVKPNSTRKLILELKDEYIEKTSRDYKTEKVEVIYQDSLDNLYKVEPGISLNKGFNTHLETFNKLPKRMNKYWVVYWNYKRKMKMSIKQRNSYPQILSNELEAERKRYEKLFKNFKFKPINPKDTDNN